MKTTQIKGKWKTVGHSRHLLHPVFDQGMKSGKATPLSVHERFDVVLGNCTGMLTQICCKNWKTIWKFTFGEKLMIAQWTRASYPLNQQRFSIAPSPWLVYRWWCCPPYHRQTFLLLLLFYTGLRYLCWSLSELGRQRFVHNFLCSLALVTILRISIKFRSSELTLQYQKLMAICRGILKRVLFVCVTPSTISFITAWQGLKHAIKSMFCFSMWFFFCF